MTKKIFLSALLLAIIQPTQLRAEDEICVSQKILSEAMAASTLVTVYGAVGYCEEKFPEAPQLFNDCLAKSIPLMASGMTKHDLLPQEEIDRAIATGRQSGKKLFHEGGDLKDALTN